MLFKRFAGVDAFPICLDARTPEEVIAATKAIAPGFGGINLEDIKSPDCFEIERVLERDLDIPVFHDDQHGTAIVVTAALMNASPSWASASRTSASCTTAPAPRATPSSR